MDHRGHRERFRPLSSDPLLRVDPYYVQLKFATDVVDPFAVPPKAIQAQQKQVTQTKTPMFDVLQPTEHSIHDPLILNTQLRFLATVGLADTETFISQTKRDIMHI